MNPRLVAIPLIGLLLTGPAVRAQTSPRMPAAPTATAKRAVTLAPTRPGTYAYWTVSKTGSGNVSPLTPDRKTATVELAPDTREIQVLNEVDETLAVLPVANRKNGETITVSPTDFRFVRRLGAAVTAANGKPVASAVVTLKDAAGRQAQRVLTRAEAGEVEFLNVPIGKATLSAAFGTNGPKVTQEITVTPGAGGKTAEVALTLPGDVPTVEAALPASGSAPPAPELALPTVNGTTAAPTEEAKGPDWLSGVIGVLVLIGLVFLGIRYWRAKGMTLEGTLRKMGVEMPQDAQGTGALKPAATPNLPPLPALSELPAAKPSPAAATVAPAAGTVASAIGAGTPRLVGLTGPVAGSVLPLEGGARLTIGRDAANAVALTGDTTVSRRHARVEPNNGGFAVVDEGSSNGTFVNGVRTQGQVLQSGDEIQIGSARFRFEG